ncbi:MAG TPA: hypothetical protein VFM90_06345, partial [Cyclobacteriaceae bacterium]|nr:hypothetical protein [Cyclobacteriaceae bacterium]
LHFLEKDKHKNEPRQRMQELPKAVNQLSMFELDPKSKAVHDLLSKIDINTISPVEALLKLNEILALMKR